MPFVANDPNINRKGRIPKVKEDDKPTNRELREKAFMELVRKFRPIQTKAIQAAVKVIDNSDARDVDKIKAAALIISVYKGLLVELYDKAYDEEPADEIQETKEDDTPTFSLKMVQ